MSRNEIGINRKVDHLGRIVIPKEIRNTLHIKENDYMEIILNRDGYIVVTPSYIKCSSCGSKKNLKTVNNITLCSKCISEFDKKEFELKTY